MTTPEGQAPSPDDFTGIKSDIKYLPEVQKSHTRKMSLIGEHKMDLEMFGTKKLRRIKAKKETVQFDAGSCLDEDKNHFPE